MGWRFTSKSNGAVRWSLNCIDGDCQSGIGQPNCEMRQPCRRHAAQPPSHFYVQRCLLNFKGIAAQLNKQSCCVSRFHSEGSATSTGGVSLVRVRDSPPSLPSGPT